MTLPGKLLQHARSDVAGGSYQSDLHCFVSLAVSFRLPSRARRDEMRCLWSIADIETPNRIFQDAIGVRHPLVLTKVIDPGIGEKSFNETAVVRRVLEHPPF